MKAGGEGGGDSHDKTEIDVLDVFRSRWVVEGLDCAGGILVTSLSQLFGNGFEEADEPSACREDEEHPKSCDHGDYEIQ